MSPSTSSYHSKSRDGPTTIVPVGKCASTTRLSPSGFPPGLVTDNVGNDGLPLAELVIPPIAAHWSGDPQMVSGMSSPSVTDAAAASYKAPIRAAPVVPPAMEADPATDARNCALASAH